MSIGIRLVGWNKRNACRHDQEEQIKIPSSFHSRTGANPTLSLVVDRELEIRNFVPQTFHKISAKFGIAEGSYFGTYQKPNFKKSDSNKHDRIDRIWEKESAEAIMEELEGCEIAEVSESKKRSPQAQEGSTT